RWRHSTTFKRFLRQFFRHLRWFCSGNGLQSFLFFSSQISVLTNHSANALFYLCPAKQPFAVILIIPDPDSFSICVHKAFRSVKKVVAMAAYAVFFPDKPYPFLRLRFSGINRTDPQLSAF